MNKHNRHSTEDITTLAEDAKALLAATAEVAGSKVAEARQRLNLALGNVRSQAVAGARVTDKAIRQHPYKAIAIALGAGALMGCVLAGRQARKNA